MNDKRCPIPGCNLHYANGITGWARHVGAPDNHPYWMPGATPAAKRHAFVSEFPLFFVGARSKQTSSRPPAVPTPPPPSVSATIPPELVAAIRQVVRETVREEMALAFNLPTISNGNGGEAGKGSR